ncbi:MAG: hypothetical protein IIU18_00260 [Oscillospiraceae bacterium]|nr:hypothetical protein [Oscillospiraceae bacterium]
MAEKKFAGVNGPVESGAVSADFETAQRFGELKVGRLGVYSRDGFRTRFLAYEETERAFVRVQEVRGRMCCAQAFFAYFRMILVCGGREYCAAMSEDEKLMDSALEAIAANAPGIAIGAAK